MKIAIVLAVLVAVPFLPAALAGGCTHTEVVYVDGSPPTYVYLASCSEDYDWHYTTPGAVMTPGCGTLPEVRVLGQPVPGTGSNCDVPLPVPQQSDSGSGSSPPFLYVCLAVDGTPTCLGPRSTGSWAVLYGPECGFSVLLRDLGFPDSECASSWEDPTVGLP